MPRIVAASLLICARALVSFARPGNIGFRLTNAHQMLQTCGCHVLMLEYRGYGHSEGTPSEHGLLLDAQAALKALQHEPALRAGTHFPVIACFVAPVSITAGQVDPSASGDRRRSRRM